MVGHWDRGAGPLLHFQQIQSGAAAMENSLFFPQEAKHRIRM